MLDDRLVCHLDLDGDAAAGAEELRHEGRAQPLSSDSGTGVLAPAVSS